MEHAKTEAAFRDDSGMNADPFSVGLDHSLAEFEARTRAVAPSCASLPDSAREARREKSPRAMA